MRAKTPFLSLIFVVAAMAAVGAAHGLPSGRESSIECRVEGGDLPVKARTTAFACHGGKLDLTVTRDYWDEGRTRAAVTVDITAEDYRRLWEYVEKEEMWNLKDELCDGFDMPIYTFRFRKGKKEKKVQAMNPGGLADRRYLIFFSFLKATAGRYVDLTE